MKVIGLTGGIGTGKSTVSRFLADLGAVVIDADRVGHEALKPGTELWEEVVATFGRRVLTTAGEVDREKLGEIVFGNPELLRQLNQIMHPYMYSLIKAKLDEYRRQGVGVVVLEATLLLEARWASLVDEVWVTVAPEAVVLRRLQGRVGLTQENSLARMRSQLSSEERTKHADIIIDTDCSLEELKTKVEQIWHGLQPTEQKNLELN